MVVYTANSSYVRRKQTIALKDVEMARFILKNTMFLPFINLVGLPYLKRYQLICERKSIDLIHVEKRDQFEREVSFFIIDTSIPAEQ